MPQTRHHAVGLGIGTQNSRGQWLEVFYPQPLYRPAAEHIAPLADALGHRGGNQAIALTPAHLDALAKRDLDPQTAALAAQFATSRRPCVATFIESDTAITSTPEAYLKLHLLSLRHCRPNEQTLDGIFAQLPNVAWTSRGAIDPAELTAAQCAARLRDETLQVGCIDKFPRMTDYVIPGGVRIAHSARIRLGAYLGEGTTVMHEGFVNFNAGSLGRGMIEGRISQGVTLGAGSNLGGGASTMGTLSGGGEIVISIGEDCLVGANGGTGIPLGDRCVIEAGLYITAGTPVRLLDDQGSEVRLIKARALAGASDLMFIRNGRSGTVECRTNRKARQLNDMLHAHN